MTSKTDNESLCAVHPYRYLFGLFWFGLGVILLWMWFQQPDLLRLLLAVAGLAAGVYTTLARRCLAIRNGTLVLERQPFGPLGRRQWPLVDIARFSWEANRALDDQIQTRPLRFEVYAQLHNGRALPLLSFFQETAAAEAAARLNAHLALRQRK